MLDSHTGITSRYPKVNMAKDGRSDKGRRFLPRVDVSQELGVDGTRSVWGMEYVGKKVVAPFI